MISRFKSGRKLKTHAFKKSDRLLRHSEFVKLSNAGRSIQNSFFIVAYYSNGRNHSRIGITASRRVGNAVTRNRLKRIIREFFRVNRDCIIGCMDINIIAKKNAANLSYQQASQSLKALFSRLKEDGN